MTENGFVPLVPMLRRLMRQRDAGPLDFCDLCGATLPRTHAHVVDAHARRLLCACGTCGSVADRASEARYRRVPGRFLHVPSMTIKDDHWEALAIPVDLAFFFFNTHLGRVVALYPGPAGATESQLPLDAWSTLERANPWIHAITPDVEALLVRRIGGEYSCFIVPIDACYELVGRIRSHWTGLSGGEVVQKDVDEFFASIVERSSVPPPGDRH